MQELKPSAMALVMGYSNYESSPTRCRSSTSTTFFNRFDAGAHDFCAPILEEGVGAEGVEQVPELDEEILPNPSLGGFKFTLAEFEEKRHVRPRARFCATSRI